MDVYKHKDISVCVYALYRNMYCIHGAYVPVCVLYLQNIIQ